MWLERRRHRHARSRGPAHGGRWRGDVGDLVEMFRMERGRARPYTPVGTRDRRRSIVPLDPQADAMLKQMEADGVRIYRR